MKGLTSRQKAIVGFIHAYATTNGFPPTRQELQAAFGWASPNSAQCHIEALVRKGALKRVDNIARGTTCSLEFAHAPHQA